MVYKNIRDGLEVLSYFVPPILLINNYKTSKNLGYSTKQSVALALLGEGPRDYLIYSNPVLTPESAFIYAFLTLGGWGLPFVFYGYRANNNEEAECMECILEPQPEVPLDSNIKDIIK